MNKLLSTKEVAKLIGVNEKMVYSLIAEKGLPATKVTGKWAFPQNLVEQWIEGNTLNYPKLVDKADHHQNLLIVTGSNDPLLDRTLALFNRQFPDQVAVFGNLGSMGGLRALRQGLCHMAASHLLQDDEEEYNFDFAADELDQSPALVNFCQREQGFLIQSGNPKGIQDLADLKKLKLTVANRPLGTGTRLLFDRELQKIGLNGEDVGGYQNEFSRHLDVGLEVLSGRADIAPGIRIVAHLLGLDFLPLRWERFDLLIAKDRFFDKNVQQFLNLLHEPAFRKQLPENTGYKLDHSGKVIFPKKTETQESK